MIFFCLLVIPACTQPFCQRVLGLLGDGFTRCRLMCRNSGDLSVACCQPALSDKATAAVAELAVLLISQQSSIILSRCTYF